MYNHQCVDNLLGPLDDTQCGQRIHWRTIHRLIDEVLLESFSGAFHNKRYFQPSRNFPECSAVKCNNVRMAKSPSKRRLEVLEIQLKKLKPVNYRLLKNEMCCPRSSREWIDCLINWLTDWYIDWLLEWLTGCLIDWLIDWSIDGWQYELMDGRNIYWLSMEARYLCVISVTTVCICF